MDRRKSQLGFLRSEISEKNPKSLQKPELNLKHCVTYIFFSTIEYNYNILKMGLSLSRFWRWLSAEPELEPWQSELLRIHSPSNHGWRTIRRNRILHSKPPLVPRKPDGERPCRTFEYPPVGES